MTEEHAIKMASAANSSRELRMLRAVEKIAGSLEGIQQTLAILSYKLIEEKYPEDCMGVIAEMAVAPPAVEITEKKG